MNWNFVALIGFKFEILRINEVKFEHERHIYEKAKSGHFATIFYPLMLMDTYEQTFFHEGNPREFR